MTITIYHIFCPFAIETAAVWHETAIGTGDWQAQHGCH